MVEVSSRLNLRHLINRGFNLLSGETHYDWDLRVGQL